MSRIRPTLHCPCQGRHLARIFDYTQPPDGETRFDLKDQRYVRSYLRCRLCGHFFSHHDMDIRGLYQKNYVDDTYGGPAGMRRAFEKIISLPPERSDNMGRVAKICEFAGKYWGDVPQARTLLDVGSGLGVFDHAMTRAGWDCTALDPDPRATAHARENVGLKSVSGDFLDVANDLGRFDAITFNKVLEHVEDPVAMLARSADCLHGGGFVYVEVPDGESAMAEGPGSEEFFIEHHHVFSAASACMLARRAGFHVVELESLTEPSAKCTLRLFLRKRSDP